MTRLENPIPKHVAVMRIVVSLLLLAAGILILTAPHVIIPNTMSEGVQKVAIGWIGAVVGYWLA